jgi:hypothetical protein
MSDSCDKLLIEIQSGRDWISYPFISCSFILYIMAVHYNQKKGVLYTEHHFPCFKEINNCSVSFATEDFNFGLYRMCKNKHNTNMSLFLQFWAPNGLLWVRVCYNSDWEYDQLYIYVSCIQNLHSHTHTHTQTQYVYQSL